MKNTIISAIQNRRELSLNYRGASRVVQPHAYGISTAGHEVLRCYQVSGSHTSDKPHDWDLLLVDGISALCETGNTFENNAPDYRRGDKAMSTIYAEL
jgi:hypothetical protein